MRLVIVKPELSRYVAVPGLALSLVASHAVANDRTVVTCDDGSRIEVNFNGSKSVDLKFASGGTIHAPAVGASHTAGGQLYKNRNVTLTSHAGIYTIQVPAHREVICNDIQ